MFLNLSKKSRKTDRNRSSRYRAKLKAKNRGRRARINNEGRKLDPTARAGSTRTARFFACIRVALRLLKVTLPGHGEPALRARPA